MDRITRLLLLFALVGVCCGAETVVTSFKDASSPLQLNKEEDVEIQCVITSEQPLGKTHILKWFKEQEMENWVLVGEDKEEKEPFNNPNKYTLNYETIKPWAAEDPVEKTLFHLIIRGVDVNDAGSYRCDVGQTEDTLQSSNPVELIILPAKSDPKIETTAAQDGEVYKFNKTNEVTCTADAQSTSPELQLSMYLNDVAVDASFSAGSVKVVQWEGSTNGLKVPITRIAVSNKEWQPEQYGSGSLKCQFNNGPVTLGTSSIAVGRDEPPLEATIGCYSTYKGALVREGKLDLVIICTAANTDDIEDLFAVFEFMNKDDLVKLRPGEYAHGRIAKADSDPQKFLLKIPRVIKEIVTPGQNIYNVTLHGTKNGNEQEIASTQFILPVDGTAKFMMNHASPITCTITSLLITSFIAAVLSSMCL